MDVTGAEKYWDLFLLVPSPRASEEPGYSYESFLPSILIALTKEEISCGGRNPSTLQCLESVLSDIYTDHIYTNTEPLFSDYKQ